MPLARYLPRFRRAYAALSQLADREAWPRQSIEQYQLDRLNETWSHAQRYVRYYRALADSAGLPEQFESLAHYSQVMPVLSKQQVRKSADELHSRSARPGSWHRTGGSTGVPMRVFWSHQAHREMLWRKYRMEQAWGLDIFDKKAFLWGHAASFAPGLRGMWQRQSQPWLDLMRNRTRFNAYCLGHEDLRSYLAIMRDRKIQCLYGYSSAVNLLAKEAELLDWELPDLKLAILTAEPTDATMLASCKRGLGCEATIEYGSVECGIIATGMPGRELVIAEDRVFLESVPNDLGQHDLIVTVLNNPSFPLLRYAIEDTTSEAITKPEIGFARLSTVAGRSCDALVAKSGRLVHALAVKHALESMSNARRFSAHQYSSGDVVLTIEASSSPQESELTAAAKKLTELLEGCHVTTDVVQAIEGNKSGKHRWVTSERYTQTV